VSAARLMLSVATLFDWLLLPRPNRPGRRK
jgi:hypothetical protein